MKIFLSAFMCVHMLIQAEEMEIYNEISDMYNPTSEDLKKVQQYLSHTPRPDIQFLKDTAFIPRNFKFIGDSADEIPQYYHLAVNSSAEERENCVIIYASFNQRYPMGAERLFSLIARSDFAGHVHCRIGGWPDLKGGSLTLAHVPFAFKVCFFKEMQKMGYKRVLYFDSSIIPNASINKFFEVIKQKGYFVSKNHLLEPYFMREETANYFGFSFEEACRLFCCHACVIGMDLTNEKTLQLIDAWYESAKDPYAFYSARSDQTALSLLLHQMGLIDWMPLYYEDFFTIDRRYVKDF